MNITTQQLIQIAPLNEYVRQEALQKFPTMTDAQRFEFEQKLWESLADLIDMRKQAKLTTLMEKAAREGLEDQIDLDAVEDEVLAELLKQIDTHSTSEQLSDVQQSLQQMQVPSIPNTPPVSPLPASPAPELSPSQNPPAMQQRIMQPPQNPAFTPLSPTVSSVAQPSYIPTTQPATSTPLAEQQVAQPPAQQNTGLPDEQQ